MLVQMSLWIYLMLLAVSLTAVLFLLLKPKKRDITRALKLGAILVIIDFLFEHFGWYAKLWSINNSTSVFPVGIVPVEVVVIAFCTGFACALLFKPKPKFDVPLVIASSLLIGLAGIWIEAGLVKAGLLVYLAITSWHALLAYFVAFVALLKINSML